MTHHVIHGRTQRGADAGHGHGLLLNLREKIYFFHNKGKTKIVTSYSVNKYVLLCFLSVCLVFFKYIY